MKPVQKKPEMQKITVMLPRDLVVRAMTATKLGKTQVIKKGLEAMAASDAYDRLRKLRGKVKFSIDLDELRRD